MRNDYVGQACWARINRSVDYIERHLDQELSLADLIQSIIEKPRLPGAVFFLFVMSSTNPVN
jgi:hypothetical protein